MIAMVPALVLYVCSYVVWATLLRCEILQPRTHQFGVTFDHVDSTADKIEKTQENVSIFLVGGPLTRRSPTAAPLPR